MEFIKGDPGSTRIRISSHINICSQWSHFLRSRDIAHTSHLFNFLCTNHYRIFPQLATSNKIQVRWSFLYPEALLLPLYLMTRIAFHSSIFPVWYDTMFDNRFHWNNVLTGKQVENIWIRTTEDGERTSDRCILFSVSIRFHHHYILQIVPDCCSRSSWWLV